MLLVVIPPMQSPDESDHLMRAYLFGQGQLVLEAPSGRATGGEIDTGLAQYIEVYSPLFWNPQRKLSAIEVEAAKKIDWTNETIFRPLPGMAYYFPAIYFVHASALRLGQSMGLSVATSYYLAKGMLLVTICAVLSFAFYLYAPSFLTLALLAIPMTIFQISSASLDGIVTALCVLLISVFLRVSQDKSSSRQSLFFVALGVWFLLAASRVQLFALIILLIMMPIWMRKIRYQWFTLVVATLVVVWQVFVLRSTVDGRVQLGETPLNIIIYYLQHIDELTSVIWRTLLDPTTARGTFSSFLGVLGWIDAPFTGSEYKHLTILIGLLALLCINFDLLRQTWRTSVLLLLVSLTVTAIIYAALLVTWTPHPASVINGIHGRYFLIPALLCVYAVSESVVSMARWRKVFGAVLLSTLALYSATNTTKLLLDRYYLQSQQP